MTLTRLFGCAAAALAVANPLTMAAAQAQQAPFRAQAQALLDQAYPAEGPGAAVIVARRGRVEFSGGRGLAELEARRRLTPDTALKLGSITKQFAAAVVLQLVAEGRISLDDPVSRFFPEWPQPGAGATVRQLLNHSSGIQDYTKIPGFMGSPRTRQPMTTAEMLAVIRERPAVSPPGERWETMGPTSCWARSSSR